MTASIQPKYDILQLKPENDIEQFAINTLFGRLFTAGGTIRIQVNDGAIVEVKNINDDGTGLTDCGDCKCDTSNVAKFKFLPKENVMRNAWNELGNASSKELQKLLADAIRKNSKRKK